jgi:hypothetical protein
VEALSFFASLISFLFTFFYLCLLSSLPPLFLSFFTPLFIYFFPYFVVSFFPCFVVSLLLPSLFPPVLHLPVALLDTVMSHEFLSTLYNSKPEPTKIEPEGRLKVAERPEQVRSVYLFSHSQQGSRVTIQAP